jgi:hypothetical protein
MRGAQAASAAACFKGDLISHSSNWQLADPRLLERGYVGRAGLRHGRHLRVRDTVPSPSICGQHKEAGEAAGREGVYPKQRESTRSKPTMALMNSLVESNSFSIPHQSVPTYSNNPAPLSPYVHNQTPPFPQTPSPPPPYCYCFTRCIAKFTSVSSLSSRHAPVSGL